MPKRSENKQSSVQPRGRMCYFPTLLLRSPTRKEDLQGRFNQNEDFAHSCLFLVRFEFEFTLKWLQSWPKWTMLTFRLFEKRIYLKFRLQRDKSHIKVTRELKLKVPDSSFMLYLYCSSRNYVSSPRLPLVIQRKINLLHIDNFSHSGSICNFQVRLSRRCFQLK